MTAFWWQRACCDCRSVWDVEYDGDDAVVGETDRICPDCGSDAIEPLAKAQERAERLADAPNARADYAYDRARDGEIG